MATPAIPNGEEHFFMTLYEGNGAGQRVGKFVPFTDNGTIANSCIFNDGDSSYLSRTPSSSGSATTFTISAWVKFGVLGTSRELFGNSPSGSAASILTVLHYTDNTIYVQGFTNGGSYTMNLQTSRTFEDTSKWYHILIAFDTTQSTSTDRVKIYVDGDLQDLATTTYPGQNENFGTNQSGIPCTIGRYNYDATRYFDGYFAEVNMVDGTALTPSTFGLTDTSTGRWIPKTLTGITYGTNGFRLQFGTSSALGDDTSGNNNDFSVNNLVAGDQTTDSPTQNHAILSGSRTRGSIVLSEGNLKITSSTTNYGASATTFKFSETNSQGFYFEVKQVGSSRSAMSVLLMRDSVSVSGLGSNQQFTDCFGLISRGGGGSNQYWLSNNGSNDVTTGVAHASDDYIQVAFKEGKVWYGINNTWIFSGNPATGANPTYNQIAGQDFRFLMTAYQNNDLECNFGQKSFNYTPPSGFVALQQDNLPETSKGVTGLTWIKDRDSTYFHTWVDSSRGANKELYSNDTSQEASTSDSVTRFLKGGVAVEDAVNVNTSGNSFVSWNWVCNGGTTETNNDGETTVTLQKNTTAGFSIGTFTSKVAAQTCGHGLGVKPDFILLKRRDGAQNWMAYHSALSSTDAYYLHLNNTDQTQTGSDFGNTVPTTTVFTTNVTGTAGRTYLFYAFASVEGFSKFGKYRGNGVADGPFVYTGFKPAFIIFKAPSSSTNWYMHDAARNPINPAKALVDANTTAAESSSYVSNGVDFLSNGFKVRQPTGYGYNYTQDIVYIAFAEHPFVGDGTNPVTAR